MRQNKAIFAVDPVLVQRQCGGWLATTPRGWPLGIGVTGTTKAETEKRFRDELARLSKIREVALA